MEKNWLIRTKSNYILGPVSKDKVLELYKNGSIKPDDEICSGNGYWFFIRESDLVTRYLLGHEAQTFNPISEAKDVLTHSSENVEAVTEPDDITMIGAVDLSLLHGEAQAEGSEMAVAAPSEPVEAPLPEPKKKNDESLNVKSINPKPKKPLKKQGYLKYIGILAFIFLFLLIFFRKSIIRSLFHGEVTSHSFSLINSAHAQDKTAAKKKSF